jgi:hypothetical protein
MGWGVVWNCTADSFLVQNPPGAMNWLIGCVGRSRASSRPFGDGPTLPGGIEDSPGVPVAPQSLYLAQLAERLGPAALRQIGYASTEPGRAMIANPWIPARPTAPARAVRETNLARNRPVLATNLRGAKREFGAWLALDDDDRTAWATDDGVAEAQLELDTEGAVAISRVELGESGDASGHVHAWTLEGFAANTWQVLATGTTIGEHTETRFPQSTVWKLRLTIQIAGGFAAIRRLAVYGDG